MNQLPDAAIHLAERQLGVLGRYQLRRWLTVDQIDGVVQRGGLVRLERGTYRVRGSAVVGQQAAFSAALRARPGATITGPAVLGHLGVDGFAPDAPFEVLVRPGRIVRNVGFPWREDPRPGRRVRRCGDVRLAVAEDALVHSVRWRAEVGDRPLRLACHWLGWRGWIDRERFLERLVAGSAHDPDAAALLAVLGGVELGRCESELERAIGRLMLGFDPAPQSQVWLTPRRRSDWYFRNLRLSMECDGVVDHDAATDRAADADADAELAELGIMVVRLGADDLRDEAALTRHLVTVVTQRALDLGVPVPAFDPTAIPPP